MTPSHSLSPTTRRSCDSGSPEFEFQFNPSLPSPTSLHSADQLFFRGLLLPLHLLPPNSSSASSTDNPDPVPSLSSVISSETESSDPLPSPSILSAGITASKRWRYVFKKTDKKPPDEDKTKHKDKLDSHKPKEKDKKRDVRKNSGGGSNSAELNINLWPFSRSRSAGNNAGRTKSGVTPRKVSSAPCSRSNSAGESKSRRTWPNSPGRISGGIHLGRTSPVWHLSRTTSGRAVEKGKKTAKSAGASTAGKGRVLNLSVPMCIGYRNHLSCRSDEASVVGGVEGGDEDGGSGSRHIGSSSGGGGNLFSLRNLFTKKVY